ncbi:MAG: DUF1801 domain-containing protein [bacterium]|nr:DUF1801 domain-containing protein [bacterium]
MGVKDEIQTYIASHLEAKRIEMQDLHNSILKVNPSCKLWFLNGKNAAGKTVSNPNIGYGSRTITYADGSNKEFYQIGLSANTAGISVYILGIEDKKFLADTFGKDLGKASVTGYCIRFKRLGDIHLHTLDSAIRFGFESKGTK